MKPMTVKDFDTLCAEDFHNGAVINEIRIALKEREELQELHESYIDIILDLYDQLEKKKPEMDEETMTLVMALEAFWTAWRETFGSGHKGICFKHYLQIKARLQKLVVPEGFVEKWWIIFKEYQAGQHPGQLSNFLEQMINELGLETEKK